MNVREYLDEFKLRFELTHDSELTPLIGASKAQIDKWIQRNSLPGKWEMVMRQMSKDGKIEDDQELLRVSIVSAVGGMADEGIEHFEVEVCGHLTIDPKMFRTQPNMKNIHALRVDGDSMLPTLKPDDYVILELGDIFDGEGLYALQWDSMLLVKRLQAGEERGVIEIVSDNKSFPVKRFNPKDDQRAFNIVGKVILRIQR